MEMNETIDEKKHHEFLTENTDFEVRSLDVSACSELRNRQDASKPMNLVWFWF